MSYCYINLYRSETIGLCDTFPAHPEAFPGHIGWFPGPFWMELLTF